MTYTLHQQTTTRLIFRNQFILLACQLKNYYSSAAL